MKTELWIGLGVLTVVMLVVLGLGLGWTLWGQHLWAAGPSNYLPGQTGDGTDGYCDGWGSSRGDWMRNRGRTRSEACRTWRPEASRDEAPVSANNLTVAAVHEAVEQYLAAQGYADLEVAEVMEFERNFYVIVHEPDTGIGAMELLVDRESGAVGPEMGPNMMWNARYGMHGRGAMMGRTGEINAIPPEEAVEIAQRWLDDNRPGISADEHVDPFYGYYTIHTLDDDQIEGMLSVHGTTGQVWYHTWHGAFIQMTEHEGGH